MTGYGVPVEFMRAHSHDIRVAGTEQQRPNDKDRDKEDENADNNQGRNHTRPRL